MPTSTDAPIYHRPIATALICITNVLVFWNECDHTWMIHGHPDMLTFGQGYHPTQWITSTFLHMGPVHLVLNLYFLWLFGLIVEGKVGWWRFLLIYLLIAAAEGFLVQTMMLGSQGGGALGASGVIFGLAAICAIWAPMNEFECLFYAFGYHTAPLRPSSINIPIGVFCCGWILWEFWISAVLWHHELSSELLHLIGSLVGFPIAFVMLRKKWVDCDNWDVVSLIQGRHQPEEVFHKEDSATLTERERQEQHDQSGKRERQIGEMLAAEEWKFAYAAWRRATAENAQFKLPAKDLLQMIPHFQQEGDHERAIVLMKGYLQHYPDQGHSVRLALASSLLAARVQPALAHRLLLELRDLELTEEERGRWRRMIRSAATRKQSHLELVDAQVGD